jgi:hypothetical protein
MAEPMPQNAVARESCPNELSIAIQRAEARGEGLGRAPDDCHRTIFALYPLAARPWLGR